MEALNRGWATISGRRGTGYLPMSYPMQNKLPWIPLLRKASRILICVAIAALCVVLGLSAATVSAVALSDGALQL